MTNNVYRQHLLNFGITEAIGPNRYSVYGDLASQQTLTPPVTTPTKSVGVNLSWYRDIGPDLNGYASFGYVNSSNVVTATGGTPVGNLNTFNAYLGINYLFARNLTGSILYSFSYWPNGNGGAVGRDIVVNQLTFSLSKTF